MINGEDVIKYVTLQDKNVEFYQKRVKELERQIELMKTAPSNWINPNSLNLSRSIYSSEDIEKAFMQAKVYEGLETNEFHTVLDTFITFLEGMHHSLINQIIEEGSVQVVSVFELYYIDKPIPLSFINGSIKPFIDKLNVFEVCDAMAIACSKISDNEEDALKYFCGICWKKIRETPKVDNPIIMNTDEIYTEAKKYRERYTMARSQLVENRKNEIK